MKNIFLLLLSLFLLNGCRQSFIAFSSNRDGNYEICTVNSDGKNYTNLTASKGDDFFPDWSHDGKYIVFYSTRDQIKVNKKDYNTEIYIMDRSRKNQVRLTDNKYADMLPSFSPDGKKIAFCSDRKEKKVFDLFLINPSGTEEINITNTNNISEKNPEWINNDKIIFEKIYMKNGNKCSRLFTINKDGTDVKQFVDSIYNDSHPSVSPSGEKVAFCRLDDTRHSKIYVANSDGKGLKRITTDDFYHDECPCWSPDGGKIAFSSWRDSRHLYIIDIDTLYVYELINPCPLNDMTPAWSPLLYN